jgi:hypothetical protein
MDAAVVDLVAGAPHCMGIFSAVGLLMFVCVSLCCRDGEKI